MPRAFQGSALSPVRTALVVSGGFVALLWVVELVDTLLGGRLEQAGVRPRSAVGFLGILWAPLIHGDWAHLIANTVPVFVLSFVILLSGVREWLRVTAIVWAIGGAGIWLIGGPNSVHVGASVLVFGGIVYLVLRGVFTRRPLQIVVGIIVLLVYGGVLWGVFPGAVGVSWQGHLFGAVGGAVAAFALRRRSAVAEGRGSRG